MFSIPSSSSEVCAKLVVLYSQPADPVTFDKAYFETHLPLARQMPGLHKVEVYRFTKNMMGGELPYYMMAELVFADMDSLKAALKSPEGKAAGENLMGFARDYVTMLGAESSVIENFLEVAAAAVNQEVKECSAV